MCRAGKRSGRARLRGATRGNSALFGRMIFFSRRGARVVDKLTRSLVRPFARDQIGASAKSLVKHGFRRVDDHSAIGGYSDSRA
jgi:hypothetical protein